MTRTCQKSRRIALESEDATDAFGHRLARHLRPGDTLLLQGPIGSGKTHLARAIIRELLGREEDVPSPTYTLVQTYETEDTTIWHADLYRLADSSELVELGLDDAFDVAIVLIEWPDRLPKDVKPKSSLLIELHTKEYGREVVLSSEAPQWANLLTEQSDV